MITIGKTPLLRAKQLEKTLNVGEIYIKLEGTNPSGHKNDRITSIICKEASEKNVSFILAEGSESFLKSLAFFADHSGIPLKIAQFKNQLWKTKAFPELEKVNFSTKRKDKIEGLKAYCAETDGFLVVEGYTHTQISRIAFESIAEEVLQKLQYDVDAFYTKLSYGYTVNSLYTALLKGWVNGDVFRFSNIICAAENDYESRLEPSYVAHTLKCIEETGGEMVSVRDDVLGKAVKLLNRTEHIKVSKNEIMPFAAFYEKALSGDLKNGRHVILLNNAKSEVEIKRIQNQSEKSKSELIAYTRKWLAQYSDSMEETADAIDNALDRGFVLIGSRNGVDEGICIVVNLGFDRFIPTYHLAYIGTKETSKGRGLATDLILKAIELTEGRLSLHVDIPNKKAKVLYEKLGFEHAYNRMIYRG